MPDIRFMCPRCRQKLVIEEAGAGLEVNCPNCDVMLVVPKSEDPQLKKTEQIMPFVNPHSPQRKKAA